MKTIILGITGSIAAYKAATIASQLVKNGHLVHCVMTQSATEFITPPYSSSHFSTFGSRQLRR